MTVVLVVDRLVCGSPGCSNIFFLSSFRLHFCSEEAEFCEVHSGPSLACSSGYVQRVGALTSSELS